MLTVAQKRERDRAVEELVYGIKTRDPSGFSYHELSELVNLYEGLNLPRFIDLYMRGVEMKRHVYFTYDVYEGILKFLDDRDEQTFYEF